MSDASKYQALAKATADAVKPYFEQMRTESAAESAKVQTLLSMLVARLEVLEAGAASAGGAKRATRGERKTGTAGGAKAADKDDLSKVKNAMLFTRRMWALDPNFRAQYSTTETLDKLAADERVTKFAEGTTERLLAEGSVVWKTCLTKPEQEDVRNAFKLWQTEREKGAIEAPLDADNGI